MKPDLPERRPRTGPLARLGDLVVARPRTILAVWALLAVAGSVAAAVLHDRLANRGVAVPGSQSVLADDLARDHIYGESRSRVSVVLTAPDGDAAALRRAAPRVRRAVKRAPRVAEVGPPRYVRGDALIGVDLRATLPQAQKRLAGLREAATDAAGGTEVTVVGEAATYDRYASTAREDLDRVERITFPVTSAIILVAFLSLVATAVPTVMAGLVLLVTFGALFALSLVANLSVFAANTALALGLGLSIDYALFNVTRFREVLRGNGGDIPGAVRETVATTGRAIAFSGLTVATAVASLVILEIGVFSAMAYGAIAAALVAVAGGLTLVPSVLVLGGRHLDRLSIRRAVAAAESARLWKAIAAFVLRRRLPVAVVSATLLLALAVPLFGAEVAFPTADALPRDEPVRAVPERLGAEIGSGAFTPVRILSRSDRKRLVAAVRRDPGVGRPLEVRRGGDGWVQVLAPLRDPTDSSAAQATIRRLRDDLTGGARPLAAAVGGTTATGIDNIDRLDARTPWVIAAALGLSVLLLFVAFRSIVVPLKAALTTLLSVGSTLGILTLLYGELGVGESGELSYFIPLFLFAVIFGLSTDYEVFLLSRIREEHLDGASSDESIGRGLVKSARSITLAGLVMAVVFLAQSTSRMEPLQQLGLGMAIAVLIDISIVRTFLVPATMSLLGERNWWLPRLSRRGRPPALGSESSRP
ncbi:MAG TPA: MMPL family transporter [Thermoleophilaceae bacterium]|jgi:RND superfamily putative drug exporter